MTSNINHKNLAGLLLFNSNSFNTLDRYIFVLLSKHGYKSSNNSNFLKSRVNVDIDFISKLPIRMIKEDGRRFEDYFSVTVESLSIPRGGMHPSDKNLIVTAIREFVEETNIYPHTLLIYDESFDLWWSDNGKIYKYKIFIGISCDFKLNTLIHEGTRFKSRYEFIHLPSTKFSRDITLYRQRENKFEEKRHLIRLTLRDYLYFMTNLQLDKYSESNYKQFFTFIENIKFFSKYKWQKYKLNLIFPPSI